MKHLTLPAICLITLSSAIVSFGEDLPSIKTKTAEMKKYDGFMPYYWDEKEGKIYLEISRWNEEILYVHYLARGIGSNDIGLDRGQLGGSYMVTFERIGPQVLMTEPNFSYRAISNNESEKRAVKESFAESVLRGWKVVAEEDDRVIVDATLFFFRDAHDISGSLKRSNQGDYKMDPDRTAFYLPRTKNFPDNSEVEVIQTFQGDSPGDDLWNVVPSRRSITVHLHHSFVRLPDDRYKMRKLDPRVGFFGIRYLDYATPIDEPIVQRYINRHRLEKEDPSAEMSEAVDPIIYYVDNGAPEPIRSALVEGASWWNQAFEAAGFTDAFQVKILPENADPLDIRYNVIQWVHRSTRGWSYGMSVADPRTGEIIKGHISLGSLRVRQDFMIAEGLLSPYEDGSESTDEMKEMALARIRQLSAHEVGHTLGVAHNFAASLSDRASVMDYPHPLVKLRNDGSIDLSDAYDAGIGEWDKVSISYGYTIFGETTDEQTELNEIIKKSINDGLIFISDSDARGSGSAHPGAHLWDNGKDALDEFDRVMKVRRAALDNFSVNNIRPGTPMATLEDKLVPIYMFHRYQTEAAAKLLGGVYYTYALRGDGQTVTEIVPPAEQRRSLSALLKAMNPAELVLSADLVKLIPPRPYAFGRTRENFRSRTGLTFDPLSAAESAASIPIRMLLNHQRAARLVAHHERDKSYPALSEILEKLISATWKSKQTDPHLAEIQRVVDNLALRQMMILAVDESAAMQVRSVVNLKIEELKKWLEKRAKKEKHTESKAHFFYAYTRILQFQDDPTEYRTYDPVDLPPGSPIGLSCGLGSNWD